MKHIVILFNMILMLISVFLVGKRGIQYYRLSNRVEVCIDALKESNQAIERRYALCDKLISLGGDSFRRIDDHSIGEFGDGDYWILRKQNAILEENVAYFGVSMLYCANSRFVKDELTRQTNFGVPYLRTFPCEASAFITPSDTFYNKNRIQLKVSKHQAVNLEFQYYMLHDFKTHIDTISIRRKIQVE